MFRMMMFVTILLASTAALEAANINGTWTTNLPDPGTQWYCFETAGFWSGAIQTPGQGGSASGVKIGNRFYIGSINALDNFGNFEVSGFCLVSLNQSSTSMQILVIGNRGSGIYLGSK